MKGKKQRKVIARRAARGTLCALVLTLFFWAVGYAPVYENERVLLGVVLMAVGVTVLFAACLVGYVGYNKLKEDLRRDYGARRFASAVVAPEIPGDSDGQADESN